MERALSLGVVLVLSAFRISAQEEVAPPANAVGPVQPSGTTYVLLIGGINKDPEEKQRKDRAILRMRRAFQQSDRVSPGNLHVLADQDSYVQSATGVSSRKNIEQTLQKLSRQVGKEDRFVFFYAGQANAVAKQLRFNLAGQDVTDQELIQWLKPIQGGDCLFIFDCPGAGRMAKPLTNARAIIVCASRSDQPYATRFSDFFVPALSNTEVDMNGDGAVSLLEAFQSTCQQVDEMFRSQNYMKSETALLEDNGDGVPSEQPWRFEEEGNDGRRAAQWFLKGESTDE